MPHFEFIVESEPQDTFRTAQIGGMFDVPLDKKLCHHWIIDLPIEERDWNIGLIYGPSGSGKTLLGKKLFNGKYYHDKFEWDENKTVIDNFPQDVSINTIISALTSVGFSSPPSWIKPYKVLSNGEKFRAELARALVEKDDIIIFDEFTSVVDRTVARIGSAAIAKAIRQQNKKFIVISCHFDILEWLCPDWTYQVDVNQFSWRSLRRLPIELRLYRVHWRAWEIFKQHHYLNPDIHKAARCFLCIWENAPEERRPVGFTSALHRISYRRKNIWGGHRTVVLPDFQGVGIGNAMVKMMAQLFVREGCIYRGTTSHPALVKYRLKHPEDWKLIKAPNSYSKITRVRPRTSMGRLTATFEYIGGEA